MANTNNNYITNLNALRGIAALLVVLLHSKDMVTYGLHLALPFEIPLISKGALAVDLFFALSGFVLMHAYHKRFESVSFSQYGQFIQNRLARIYPLYLAVLLALGLLKAMALCHWIPYLPILNSKIDTDAWSFISSILMIQSWHLHDNWTWNLPAWSISSEWFVYLIAPFIISACIKLRHPVQIILLYCVSAALVFGLHFIYPDSYFTYDFGNIRMLSEFCMGVCMYQTYQWLTSRQVKLPYTLLFTITAITSLGLMAFADVNNAILVNLNIFLILFAANAGGLIRKFLSSKPMFYLGEISYSIYIIHFAIVSFLSSVMRPMLVTVSGQGYGVYLAVCTVTCILLAHFSYQYIESPCRNWLKSKDKKLPSPIPNFPSYACETP